MRTSPVPSLPLAGLAAALLLLVPRTGSAQGEVRGLLFDSLLTQAGVPDALVAISGTTLQGRTDRRGRFEIRNVPAGRQILQYWAPWTDSLSLLPLSDTIVVRDGRVTRTLLATPSVAAYHRAVCGATFDETQGVLRGEVRGADGRPRAGVFVGAVWSEAIVTRAGLGGQLIGAIDTTNAAGFFALCGVPRATSFFVRAGDDSVSTGDLSLTLDGRSVGRRDLLIGSRRDRAQLRGRVVTTRGTPVLSVVVAVPGDTLLGVRGDEEGRFTLVDVPQRTTQLLVRSLGFTPQYLLVDIGTSSIELPDVVLEALPLELEERRVVERASTLEELGFRERQRVGVGTFIDATELARYPVISANVLAAVGTGVRSTGGVWPRTLLRRGIQPCYPRFFIDGVDFGLPTDGIEEAAMLGSAKRIEIYEASFMPARFTDFNGCGVVLVWTR